MPARSAGGWRRNGSCSCLARGKKLPREAAMRGYVMRLFDLVVFGSFAVFLASLAWSIPADARLRLLYKAVELVRNSGGF